MGNELMVADETIAALDRAAANGLLAQNEVSAFKRTMLIAESIKELRNLLTPKVMEPIMALQNTSIGFKTDNPSGYPMDIVRDCVIEAVMKGVYVVGNEFNIIQRQCYITKEGYSHKLHNIPNFGFFETPSIPRIVSENGAIIKIRLDWSQKGQKESQELELAIKANKGMGADAIIGKAKRKARAWLWERITGQEIGDGDVEDVIDIQASEVKSPFEEPPGHEDKTPVPSGTEVQDTLPM